MPLTIEMKHAFLTLENPPTGRIQDYLIEIQYDDDNKPIKLWIHDSMGRTLLRIQVKPNGTEQ